MTESPFMIAFPAAAALIALICAAVVGWDAVRRTRPERTIWTIAFLVFAVAASTEVIGQALGWSPMLARVYYLAGAVLVVGILALGELYLLFPGRMPAVAPGIALLTLAIAATTVWSAPVDAARLPSDGWRAIERGPFLVALAATINAGGTVALVGGALYSAFNLRARLGARQRVAGCLLIAIGTVVVALGGTLTRFGWPGVLYLAMALGITIIFGGVLLTRQPLPAVTGQRSEVAARRPRLVSLPSRTRAEHLELDDGNGLRYVTEVLLPLDDESIADACRRWSATPILGDALTRDQARQAWALRISLPESSRDRYDLLPLTLQAQLAELFEQVWSQYGSRDELRA